jgi:hypothetical protein
MTDGARSLCVRARAATHEPPVTSVRARPLRRLSGWEIVSVSVSVDTQRNTGVDSGSQTI